MDINELLNKIATPGDVAAAGIGFVLGLPLDYFLFHMAVSPGIVSGYTAVATFSLKKVADAYIERRRALWETIQQEEIREKESKELTERKQKELEAQRQELSVKVWRLKSFFKEEALPETTELVTKLDKMHDAHILSDEEFESSLQQIMKRILSEVSPREYWMLRGVKPRR